MWRYGETTGRSPEDVVEGARVTLRALHELSTGSAPGETELLQTLATRTQLALMAAAMPLASLGTCHCGNDLRYKGTPGGLQVCCTNDPEHCWKIA
jgi:hypothetical protein